jgi:hypothetical protein
VKAFYQILGNTLLANITNLTVGYASLFMCISKPAPSDSPSFQVSILLSGYGSGLVDHYKKNSMIYRHDLVIYIIGLSASISSRRLRPGRDSPTIWFLFALLLESLQNNDPSPSRPVRSSSRKARDKASGFLDSRMAF